MIDQEHKEIEIAENNRIKLLTDALEEHGLPDHISEFLMQGLSLQGITEIDDKALQLMSDRAADPYYTKEMLGQFLSGDMVPSITMDGVAELSRAFGVDELKLRKLTLELYETIVNHPKSTGEYVETLRFWVEKEKNRN